ncbi:hypothetical protein [Fodinicola feengrottensis]|uniref:hypothetical protein n=1 Tax=Fodinicola feengrottensis TaxID=435914 RepID=UPI0013D7BBEE|nr:hypothetical protein [Fodinicola feengrottensis]
MTDVQQRVAGDPAGATLRSVIEKIAVAYVRRPLLKAVLLRDMEVIGKLSRQRELQRTPKLQRAGWLAMWPIFGTSSWCVRTSTCTRSWPS